LASEFGLSPRISQTRWLGRLLTGGTLENLLQAKRQGTQLR